MSECPRATQHLMNYINCNSVSEGWICHLKEHLHIKNMRALSGRNELARDGRGEGGWKRLHVAPLLQGCMASHVIFHLYANLNEESGEKFVLVYN